MPALNDANFSKSVIYVYEHTAEGAMGLIINKPLQINLGNIMHHLKIKIDYDAIINQPVIMGGPVQPEQGFVIHPAGSEDEDGPAETDDNEILVSTSKELLTAIAAGKGPEKFLISLGYSGWSAGQLEQEMNRNDWLLAPFNPDILFNEAIDRRWTKAAKLIGIDINLLSNQVGHA